jgi:hypothetical protein
VAVGTKLTSRDGVLGLEYVETDASLCLACIDIAVMERATRFARPGPIAERKNCVLRSTFGAELRGRKPSVDNEERRARHLSLVLQLPPKLEETNIGDRTGELPVCEHPDHVKVFDHNAAIAREARHELVQDVGPDVGDLPVQSCELGFCLGTMTRAALLARQRTRKPFTRAYSATMDGCSSIGASTRIVPPGNWRQGTGIVSAFTQRQAVL